MRILSPTRPRPSWLCLGVAALLLPSCGTFSSTDQPLPPFDGEKFAAERQAEWNQLNRLKAEIAWDHDEPATFNFPGHGEVTVRKWALQGGPGWEYVKAKFTYRNTTEENLDWVDVVLSVQDDDKNEIVASRVKLNHPWGLPLAPGTSFSDEIQVATAGAHRGSKGWRWNIHCVGIPYEPIEELGSFRAATAPAPVQSGRKTAY